MIHDLLDLLVNQIAVAILKLSKRYSPGSSRNKSRRWHSSKRNRQELDKDGVYETE